MFDDRPGESHVFDFDELADHLLEQGLEASPAELHGCVTGLISAGAVGEPGVGLAGVNQALDLDIHGELAEQVMQLYSVTLAALEDDAFDFHPLLPDDDSEMQLRAEALGLWCSGFLAGYARAGGSGKGQGLPEDSAEILRDFAAMAQAGTDEEDSEEESERHYAELVEYLRFAALNVYMDSLGQVAEDTGSPPRSVH